MGAMCRRGFRRRFLPALLLAVSSRLANAQGGGFPYDDWSRVLAAFVDDGGRVDYAALAAAPGDLNVFLARIAAGGPRSTPQAFPGRNDRLAYYVNAYNALVFDGVLKRGPERVSVWKGGLVSGYSFFVGMKVRLDGTETNLKALEDKVIRKGFSDPRVHAALNCASIGCPRLPREAFLPDRLDAQLDAAMTEFLEDERNVSVDAAGRTVTLSRIFDWFEDDFLDDERARGNAKPVLADFVNRYRKTKPPVDRTFRVRFADYDKRLNAR
jgi:hypothetical protein